MQVRAKTTLSASSMLYNECFGTLATVRIVKGEIFYARKKRNYYYIRINKNVELRFTCAAFDRLFEKIEEGEK